MDDYAPGEHGEPRTVYVRFGPQDHQEITADVASMVLTAWCERAPETFGAYLAEVMAGARPRGSRQ